MQSRKHYLEIALDAAIAKKEFNSVVKLIAMIEEDPDLGEKTLESFNEEGRSFLCHALFSQAEIIANFLLQRQKRLHLVLFAKDKNKCLPLHYALEHGYLDIAEKIIHYIENESKAAIKNWLGQEQHGRTPLHYACNNNHVKIVNLLIEKILKSPNAINIINQVDSDGNTALHLACQESAAESAELMVRFGADPFVRNNTGLMPLGNTDPETLAYIVRHGALIGKDLPSEIISALNGIRDCRPVLLLDASVMGVSLVENNPITGAILHANIATKVISEFSSEEQNNILTYCKQALLLNPHAQEINKFYFTVISLCGGLTGLLIAKFELSQAVQEANLSGNIFDKVPVELLERIPRFVCMYNTLSRKSIESKIEPIQEALNPFDYQTLAQDRETLDKIIKNITLYLTHLKGKPKTSTGVIRTKATVPVLVGLLYVFLYIVVAVWLTSKVMEDPAFWHGGRRDPKLQHYHTAFDWMVTPFALTIPGGFILLWAVLDAALQVFLDERIILSPQEWNHLRVLIEEELLDKLLGLEQKEKLDRVNEGEYLPTDREVVRRLEELVALLEERLLVDEAINLFATLKKLIKKIKNDMNISNHPLSLFFKPTKIEARNECVIDMADEATMLVPFQSPVKTYGGFN